MPKLKTRSGAKKRFRTGGTGRIKRGSAYRRHILTKKATKRKRHLRGATSVHDSDARAVRTLLPYA
jgi:large subunit ribosomal protein L35